MSSCGIATGGTGALLAASVGLSASEVVPGKIIYKKTEEDAKMKEIQFKNAYIVHYSETLDANNDVPMTITITFSAEEIIVGSAALDNRWPKK